MLDNFYSNSSINNVLSDFNITVRFFGNLMWPTSGLRCQIFMFKTDS